MRESRSSGSVRGAASDGRPYRDRNAASSVNDLTGSTQPDRHIPGYVKRGARFGRPRTPDELRPLSEILAPNCPAKILAAARPFRIPGQEEVFHGRTLTPTRPAARRSSVSSVARSALRRKASSR